MSEKLDKAYWKKWEKDTEDFIKQNTGNLEMNTNALEFIRKKIDTENICGYVAILLLDYGIIKYSLLMIDANNIEKNFRESIELFLKNKGFEPVVISTDNHSKTGMPPKLEYKPAGADKSDEKAIFSFLEKLDLDDIKNHGEIKYCKKNIKGKIMGEQFLDNLAKAFLTVGKKGVYLFFAVLALQLLIAILLGFLMA